VSCEEKKTKEKKEEKRGRRVNKQEASIAAVMHTQT